MGLFISRAGIFRIDLSDDYYLILHPSGGIELREVGIGDVLAENSNIQLPDWLAYGIRELVKNKIEQENDRGA